MVSTQNADSMATMLPIIRTRSGHTSHGFVTATVAGAVITTDRPRNDNHPAR